jgi:aconitase A
MERLSGNRNLEGRMTIRTALAATAAVVAMAVTQALITSVGIPKYQQATLTAEGDPPKIGHGSHTVSLVETDLGPDNFQAKH